MNPKTFDFSKIPMAELAAIVAEHLKGEGIHVVLVGGLAVEIYTDNLYLTQDIDMVNTNLQPPRRIAEAMQALGFTKQGRVFEHSTTPIVVEFPTAPLSVGNELIKDTTHFQIGGRRLPILKVDDVVKDRLAAFLHWRDNSSLIQAVAIMLKHNIQPIHMQDFCFHEGTQTQFELLSEFYCKASEQKPTSMAVLETILTQLLLNRL